jgi:hypothetical protein
MAQSTQPISPLRQRMIEDMTMCKLAPKTQASYIGALRSWPITWATRPIPLRQKTYASFSCT